MEPASWGIGDMIAAWIFMTIPLAAGVMVGRMFEYFRTKDQR